MTGENKMAKTKTRDVFIKHKYRTFLVLYKNRKKYGNFCAAQFNDVDSDLKKVEDWVKSNPKLNLICS